MAAQPRSLRLTVRRSGGGAQRLRELRVRGDLESGLGPAGKPPARTLPSLNPPHLLPRNACATWNQTALAVCLAVNVMGSTRSEHPTKRFQGCVCSLRFQSPLSVHADKRLIQSSLQRVCAGPRLRFWCRCPAGCAQLCLKLATKRSGTGLGPPACSLLHPSRPCLWLPRIRLALTLT